MSEIRTFSVPGKPHGKGRPRFSSKGGYPRTYTPEATRSYEELVRVCYLDKYRGREAMDGKVAMAVYAVFPIPASASKKARKAMEGQHVTKKPDIDNVLKVVQDALNGLAYRDDNQICSVYVSKTYEHERMTPQVIVHLEQLDGVRIPVMGEET